MTVEVLEPKPSLDKNIYVSNYITLTLYNTIAQLSLDEI
jgi:hypothetical protein